MTEFIQDFVFLRTYSRRKEDGYIETREEALERVICALNDQLKMNLTINELYDIYEILYNKKASVAGRFMWQLGSKTVEKYGLLSLQNCAAVVVDEPVLPFLFTMDCLMLGVGVGLNIQKKYISKLPRIKQCNIRHVLSKDADFIIPDSREGWIKLLKKILKSHFITGKDFTYSTICIRPKGKEIKGFGGVSSGSEPLVQGMKKIDELLNKNACNKPSSVLILDIIDLIASVVISGNVRRSAILILGDDNDVEYLNAKNWESGSIPYWRSYSNNSVVCNDIHNILENNEFWNGYNGSGEPYGLINLKLSRQCGRLNEYDYDDPDVVCYNPCAEQSLENYETCCLAEVFLPNIPSKQELFKVVKYLYRICKHSLNLKCHWKETERIVHKNQRMGIGVTGIMQCNAEQLTWLRSCYNMLREYDVYYSRKYNFNTSIKLTTCKPSGTLSLIGGTSPGVHPSYARYYIRRVRLSSNDPLLEIARNLGYKIENVIMIDGSKDVNTFCVEFPCHAKGIIAEDMTAIKQLEMIKYIQKNWSDNSVSCTVYYKKEELEDIKYYLKCNYNDNFKTLSFLLHSDHGFKQAPYEQITEEQYINMKKDLKEFDKNTKIKYQKYEELNIFECAGGSCPVK
jgi:ribonucleotide reductase alpha subunit